MEHLRPHHVVCLTRLYPALSLLTFNKDLYYDSIKDELAKTSKLSSEYLDNIKYSWGTIYGKEVMEVLVKIIHDGRFVTTSNTCDSICSACYGKTNNKCVGENSIQYMDKLATIILNHIPDKIFELEKLKDHYMYDRVCDICGTKDKCKLIRRATNKVAI